VVLRAVHYRHRPQKRWAGPARLFPQNSRPLIGHQAIETSNGRRFAAFGVEG
jgi:hypothetical protein